MGFARGTLSAKSSGISANLDLWHLLILRIVFDSIQIGFSVLVKLVLLSGMGGTGTGSCGG